MAVGVVSSSSYSAKNWKEDVVAYMKTLEIENNYFSVQLVSDGEKLTKMDYVDQLFHFKNQKQGNNEVAEKREINPDVRRVKARLKNAPIISENSIELTYQQRHSEEHGANPWEAESEQQKLNFVRGLELSTLAIELDSSDAPIVATMTDYKSRKGVFRDANVDPDDTNKNFMAGIFSFVRNGRADQFHMASSGFSHKINNIWDMRTVSNGGAYDPSGDKNTVVFEFDMIEDALMYQNENFINEIDKSGSSESNEYICITSPYMLKVVAKRMKDDKTNRYDGNSTYQNRRVKTIDFLNGTVHFLAYGSFGLWGMRTFMYFYPKGTTTMKKRVMGDDPVVELNGADKGNANERNTNIIAKWHRTWTQVPNLANMNAFIMLGASDNGGDVTSSYTYDRVTA